jgi:threonine/homoserine/homoserine lactone efflux protein
VFNERDIVTDWPVDPHAYGQYLILMAGMAASPGPANLFALATGLERGARAGLMGVVGMNAASLVWFVCAAIGLGALMNAFPAAFKVLAIIGGLYLAWLGFKALKSAFDSRTTGISLGGAKAANRPFVDGFIVQITNPKALLFFTAVLPPFLDLERAIVPQLVMLGAATIAFDVIQMSLYALAGAMLAAKFGQARFARIFSGCIGAILLTTAVLVLVRATD